MPVVFAIGSATGLVLVGRALISLNSLANLVPDTFLLDPVYAGDKLGGIWLSRYWRILIP